MTAVFPSSTSMTCCTSNLKSWRSGERREGAGWASMEERGRQCDISGWASGWCLSVFGHNQQLQEAHTLGVLWGRSESFLPPSGV